MVDTINRTTVHPAATAAIAAVTRLRPESNGSTVDRYMVSSSVMEKTSGFMESKLPTASTISVSRSGSSTKNTMFEK